MISADSVVTIGTGLLLAGGVVFGWRHTFGRWQEFRTDWRDFRAASANARENARERRAFASSRTCSDCHAPLDPKRLFRAVQREPLVAAGAKWVYRCRCGESTWYDDAGAGHHLEHASAA